MITQEEIRKRRDEIIAVAKRNGASNVRIFGSVARGDNRDSSDLDLLVRFESGSSLMDHGMLKVTVHVPALQPQIEAILTALPPLP